MNGIINAILPIVGLLAIGYFCKKNWIKDSSFWNNVNKLIYYIMFPCLMVSSIGRANFDETTDFSFIPVLVFIVIFFVACIWLAKPLFKSEGFWVAFIQGGVRYNSYVFIAITLFYVDDDVMPVIALITAFLVMTTNVISVFILNKYSENKLGQVDTILATLKNPLVFSCLLGLGVNALSHLIPIITHITWINNMLGHIGKASLTLSLMSVGASLNFGVFKDNLMEIILCSGVKLILLPLTVVFVLLVLDFDPLLTLVCMIYAGSPCSSNATAMTQAMGGDYESMSMIISVQTVLSILTLPVLMYGYSVYVTSLAL